MKQILSPAVFFALAVTGCVTAPADTALSKAEEAQKATIKGSAGYRERIALLPGAVMNVSLSDISRADAPAEMLAEQTIDLTDRSVPVDFTLNVDPASLKANMRYAVRAEIRGTAGQLMWTTDTVQLIDPQAIDQTLPPIMLVKVPAAKPDEAPASVSLIGTNWRVEDIDGAGVLDNSNTTLMFGSDGRVHGVAGCNSYTGTYTLADSALSFGPLAVTRKACVPALADQEAKFLALIESVVHVQIAESGILTLTTADGRTLRAAS